MTHRPLLRFTIRDVLWLTVVVGIVIAWGLDRVGTNRLRYDIQTENLEVMNALMQENAELRMKLHAIPAR